MMRKVRNIYLILLLTIITIIIFTDIVLSSLKRKNIETFLQVGISSLKVIGTDKTILKEDDITSCFVNLFTQSEMTSNDLQRGETANICNIQLINNNNKMYEVVIIYSDTNEAYRVIFSDSKNVQFNFIKNKYFYEFINLYNSYITD